MAGPMQEKFTALTPALYDYLVAHNPPPDPVLRDLAAETAALGPISPATARSRSRAASHRTARSSAAT